MKKLILPLLSLLIAQNTFAAGFLVPSLEVQMKKQAIVDKNRFALERQMRNEMRIAQLREKAQQRRAMNIKKSQNTPQTTTQPQIRVASQVSIPTKIPLPITPVFTPSTQSSIPGVDMNRVRSTWIGWYNDTRASLGLAPYSYDTRLDATAHDWNIVFASGKGQNHHRRNPADAYYDFWKIDSWFTQRGVDPDVIGGAKHTENVGYGYYTCTNGDCTDELISAIRSTYNFYMSEKGKSYDAHYRSIIQPNFSKIGLDIIVVPSEKRYYLTVHYITK